MDEAFSESYEKSLAREKARKEALIKGRTLDSGGTTKEIEIPWDSVEGAVKYQVQIKDSDDSVLTDKEVTTNAIRISLVVGEYRMRVGAVNKFEKVGAWSEWADIKIVSREDAEKSTPWNRGDGSFSVAAGISHVALKADISDRYNADTVGWTFLVSCRLSVFSGIRDLPVLKNTALELQADNYAFNSRNDTLNIEENLDITMAGLNLKFVTDFNFPLNIALRAGAGVAYSRQELRIPPGGAGSLENEHLATTDPVYRAGISAFVGIPGGFFVEGGGDYFLVDYLSEDFSGFRFFLLAGIKI